MKEKLTYEKFRRTAIGLIILSSLPIVPTIVGFYLRNIAPGTFENPPADTLPEYWAIGALLIFLLGLATIAISLILFISQLIGEFVEAFIQSWYG